MDAGPINGVYSFTHKSLSVYDGCIMYIHKDGNPVSFASVIDRWATDQPFSQDFSTALANLPYPAFFWELPPLTHKTLHHNFQCAVINSPTLAQRRADERPFSQHFSRQQRVISFQNLGTDATLIVPEAVQPQNDYCHLASFLRHAPRQLISQLWEKTATTLQQSISSQPLWTSTSGLGVSWLHIRLDQRPKYYVYTPYRVHKPS